MAGTLRTYYSIVKDSGKLFIKNDPLKLGGATAFFTLFALPPVLTILVTLLSFFINPQALRHEMFTSLSETFGKEAVRQLISVIRAIRQLNSNLFSTIIVFSFMLFVATTVFRVIRSSINQVWNVVPATGKKVVAGIKGRLVSVGVLVVTALLFSTGMFIETLQVLAGDYFARLFPSVSGLLSQSLSFIISLFIVALWFTIIFRFLNDRHPRWRVAWAGGLFTSVLFSVGKILLHWLLSYNKINTIYGASAAMVLLLLFVFYAAMLLYFGAAFTHVWEKYTAEKE